MARKRTFEVVEWADLPSGHPVVETLDLICKCGTEAVCPVASGVNVEGRSGMSFITDPATPPQPFFMPKSIRCRRCGRVYTR